MQNTTPRCALKVYRQVKVRTGGALNRTTRCPRPGTIRMIPNPRSRQPGTGDLLICDECATRIERRGVWAWTRATNQTI